jgi:flavin-dependent dehydrogenase
VIVTDVLIAGGGIAGSSLAILLGRQGFSVELYERSRFPREKPCGEGLMPAGVAVLERLGVAAAVGGAPLVGIRYHAGEESFEGRFPHMPGLPDAGRGQRRRHLDQVLFAAAAETPGVRAETGVEVSAPLVDGGRVTGLVVDGEARRARLVVAADGANSRVRHQLGLSRRVRRKRFGACMHFRLASGAEISEWVEIFLGEGYEFYVTPLPAGEVLVAMLCEARAMAAPLEEQFDRWRREHRALERQLEGAVPVTEILSTAPLSARSRAGVAPGVILLGDAAGSTDPITGGGMTQALLSAELLARELAGGIPADDRWIWDYQCRRNEMLRDYQRLTRVVLGLSERPRLARAALRLLEARPALFSHLLGVTGGARRLLGRPPGIPPWLATDRVS